VAVLRRTTDSGKAFHAGTATRANVFRTETGIETGFIDRGIYRVHGPIQMFANVMCRRRARARVLWNFRFVSSHQHFSSDYVRIIVTVAFYFTIRVRFSGKPDVFADTWTLTANASPRRIAIINSFDRARSKWFSVLVRTYIELKTTRRFPPEL